MSLKYVIIKGYSCFLQSLSMTTKNNNTKSGDYRYKINVMFKKLFLGAFMLVSVSAFAQEQNQPAAEVDSKATSEIAEQISLANQLVKYGYQTKSALPLIQAIQIYKKFNVTEEAREKTTEGGTAASESLTKTQIVSFDETKILDDATKFAAGNKNLLALISDAKKASRGPIQGTVRHNDCVNAGATDQYKLRCEGGTSTTIIVSGDGDTDLDLYVYDSYGNLVAYDDDGLDDCIVRFTPRYNHTFTVRIKNRGRVYNCYTLLAF